MSAPEAGTERELPPYRWVILGVIMGVLTVANIGPMGLPSLAPLVRADLALSRQQAGSFLSAYYVGSLVMAFPAGWLADRLGVGRTLIIGQLVVAVFLMAMAFTPSYPLLMLAVVLAGIGYGMVNPTSTKGVMIWFPARSRGTVVGLKQTGLPLGGALGALILPALAGILGWRGAMAASGAAVGASALLALWLYREPPRPAVAPGAPTGRPSVRTVLTNPSLWLVSCATLLFAAVQVAWISYLSLYLQEVLALSVVAAGFYLAQGQVSGTIGRILFGLLSDRLFGGRRRIILVLAGSLSGCLSLLMATVSAGTPGWALSLLAIFFGLVGIGWNGVQHALLAELAGRESAGTAVGLGLAVSALGVILGPPLFGLLVDRLADYRWAWYSMAGAMALALVLLAPVKEPRRRLWE